MSISQAVQEAIKANLPGMVAGELQEFIAQAKKTETELANATALLKVRNEKIDELQAILTGHKELAVREQAVAKREADQSVNELALLRRECFLEAKLAQAELTGVKDTVNLFLRNVTVRQTVVADVAKPVEGMPPGNGLSGYGGMLQRDQKPDTTTTSETQE